VLPVWIDEDKQAQVAHDLEHLAKHADHRKTLTAQEIGSLAPRVRMDILGGADTPSFNRLMVPAKKIVATKICYLSISLRAIRSAQRTRSRLSGYNGSGSWWQKLYADVQAVVRRCLIRQLNKSKPVMSGRQRSREYDGPFRFLVLYFVGPMRSEIPKGCKRMFTCAFRVAPTFSDDSAIAADVSRNRVICDIAG
jgi:hypothetical protein